MRSPIDATERARRLGEVAAILIDLARRHAGQVAATDEGKQVSRPADDAPKGSNPT